MEYFCYVDRCTIITTRTVFHNSRLPVVMLRCTSTQKRMLAILFRNRSLTSAKCFTLRSFPCSFHEVDKMSR